MHTLAGRRILLGITGGIAAYKSAILVRELRRAEADVRVVMTRAAQSFITPLTLQALSGREVHVDLLDPAREAAMGHIELARWADAVVIAPATADFIARLAHGLADDLLSTICLASRACLALAPAMNHAMWEHPATQQNVQVLSSRGGRIWGPAEGDQACGDMGTGRMMEPDELAKRIAEFWCEGPLLGVDVLITAGPTREPIDPVRYLSNRSSGKMGYALATAMRELGASVALVSGPTALAPPPGVERIEVETAVEMRKHALTRARHCSLFVAAAAVSDYRAAQQAEKKIKKGAQRWELPLVPNPDILAEVAALPNAPFTVGFAAETQALEQQAEHKRRSKGIDMIAANLVGKARGGFDADDNALILYWEGGKKEFPLCDKTSLAREVAVLIAEHYHAKYSAQDSGPTLG